VVVVVFWLGREERLGEPIVSIALIAKTNLLIESIEEDREGDDQVSVKEEVLW
jgi:hypothetical protein